MANFAWATAPYTYRYDFGDGTSVIEGGSGQTYIYQTAGTYTLTVTVTDADGTVKTATRTITAREPSNPPNTPTLISPDNNTTNTSLTPILTTGSFLDPDSGYTHLKTDWQLSDSAEFTFFILSESSNINLTTLSVPDCTLSEGTTYYWKAKFYDQDNTASEWSSVYSFTTLTTTNDTNTNGIPDIQEVSAAVDMDEDGEFDNQQDDIKSLNTVVGNEQLGISRKNDPAIIDIPKVESIDHETISGIAIPYSMPTGMVSIKLTVEVGSTVELTIYFSEAAPAAAIWLMYDTIIGWTDYSDYATFSPDMRSVVLQLQDGGYGDADGVANGIIIDPGGYGLAAFVNGTVKNSAGTVISNANITFTMVLGGMSFSIPSIYDGTFFSVLLPGDYTVEVSAAGYASISSSISIAEATLSTGMDFNLVSNIVAPTLTTSVNGGIVTATWSTAANASSYTLYYAPYPYEGEHTIGSINMGESTSISVELPSGAAFYVAITAWGGGMESEYSNIGFFEIP